MLACKALPEVGEVQIAVAQEVGGHRDIFWKEMGATPNPGVAALFATIARIAADGRTHVPMWHGAEDIHVIWSQLRGTHQGDLQSFLTPQHNVAYVKRTSQIRWEPVDYWSTWHAGITGAADLEAISVTRQESV